MDTVSMRSYGDDKTPDRAKPWRPHPLPEPKYLAKSIRKVQVVYYLARNSGRLEHPHYLEVTLAPNQPLRLKDVLDRLAELRGTVMPSQYSWSYKRTYGNGYIWVDLAASDIIHPSSEGPAYVLKGSELSQDTSERFEVEPARLSRRHTVYQAQTSSLSSSRRRSFRSSPLPTEPEAEIFQECENREEEVNVDGAGEKRSIASLSATPYCRCQSKGVTPEAKEEEVARRRPWIDLLQLMSCGSSSISKAKKKEKEIVMKMPTERPAEAECSRWRNVQSPVETTEAAAVNRSNSERCRKTRNVFGEIEEEEEEEEEN